MVLSDGTVHFLKIKKIFKSLPNYLVALTFSLNNHKLLYIIYLFVNSLTSFLNSVTMKTQAGSDLNSGLGANVHQRYNMAT